MEATRAPKRRAGSTLCWCNFTNWIAIRVGRKRLKPLPNKPLVKRMLTPILAKSAGTVIQRWVSPSTLVNRWYWSRGLQQRFAKLLAKFLDSAINRFYCSEAKLFVVALSSSFSRHGDLENLRTSQLLDEMGVLQLGKWF